MRCNQDNQREYEERCFRQISQHLFHQNSNSNTECSRLLTGTNSIDLSQRSGNKLLAITVHNYCVLCLYVL